MERQEVVKDDMQDYLVENEQYGYLITYEPYESQNFEPEIDNEDEYEDDYDYCYEDDYDYCYECGGYGDDYSFDSETGEMICNCFDCPRWDTGDDDI